MHHSCVHVDVCLLIEDGRPDVNNTTTIRAAICDQFLIQLYSVTRYDGI